MYPKAVFPSKEENVVAVDPSKLMGVKDMRAMMIQNRTSGPLAGKGIVLPDAFIASPMIKITWEIVECDGLTTLIAVVHR